MAIIGSQDDLITELGRRTRYAKKDVKNILDGLVELFEELVENNPVSEENKTIELMRSRSLGKLYVQYIPERKDRVGEMLPSTSRIIFKLSENIRYADRQTPKIEVNDTLDETEE